MRIGLIGYGYWGPNILRNIISHTDVDVSVVADLKLERLAALKKMYPTIRTTTDASEVVENRDIDAVIVATPVHTHYPLAKAALEAGKHVLVEKPLADSLNGAEELIAIAKKKKLVLMVDHTYIYTGAVETIKKIVDSGELGTLQSFSSTRFNLGLFQGDVNVLWDLAPHDLSILLYLTERIPTLVNAIGVSHTENGVENIAYLTLRYDDGLIAHVGTSWVSPVKIRQILISGDQKMIAYDDTEAIEKVKVYEAGYTVRTHEDKRRLYMDYRSGDIHIPNVGNKEALQGVVEDFVRAISKGSKPRSDARFGLNVVRILDAAERSLKQGGAEVRLS
ncbi:Gfo/Idh/MocA family oxidoreductase [Candidatus Kaiserbacteria bacterium]|nr:Gfo/Idh/MocA family oxidoreductase [Candidatus Kaiserbacteria bacterium]